MTYEEAKERLEHNESFDVSYTFDCEAIDLAIEALEKQIPKKPVKRNPAIYQKDKCGNERVSYSYFCPQCNEKLKLTDHHCICGQAIDWSDAT